MASRGQGTLLEIPDMPVFPRMSHAAAQTRPFKVYLTEHTKLSRSEKMKNMITIHFFFLINTDKISLTNF